MIVAPLTDAVHDIVLSQVVIPGVAKSIEGKNQDWIMLCVGPTGTGKTSLGMHAYELYDQEECSVEYISLNRQDLAGCYVKAKAKERRRFVMFDEADVSRREALSKFNRDFISLNSSIRGLNIFQWWNHPSAEWFDRPFIEETIKGLIFILDKNKDVRRYLYFDQRSLIRLLKDKGDIKHDTMRKHGTKYALYMGWFRAYKGKLWAEYIKKKQDRMEYKVEDFFQKYGLEKGMSANKAARVVGVRTISMKEAARDALEQGLIPPECRDDRGLWHLNEQQVLTIKEFLDNSRRTQRDPTAEKKSNIQYV